MSVSELIAIFHHRWSAPVLAELLRRKGSRFAALTGTLGVGRESLRRTLDSLLAERRVEDAYPSTAIYVATSAGRRLRRIVA